MMSMAKSWIPISSSNINKDAAAATAASNCSSSRESKAVDVGLKILTNSKSKTINHSKPILQRNQLPSSTTSCYHYKDNQIPAPTCFLKSCFLCHHHLSPNKDIYMYRGDRGFCSEECRNRQIYMDDVEQLQIKIMLRQSQSHTTFNGRRLHCSNHRAPSSTLHTPSPTVFS